MKRIMIAAVCIVALTACKQKENNAAELAFQQQRDSLTRIIEQKDNEIDDMMATMYAKNGVGLSGNQVGKRLRVVVVDCRDEEDQPLPYKLVNPVITYKSEETLLHSEGCLSLPREYADVERAAEVEVSFLDENGTQKTLRATGLLAIALQHEIDHLDGVLFIDYLSPFKRKRLLQHLEKRRKKEGCV